MMAVNIKEIIRQQFYEASIEVIERLKVRAATKVQIGNKSKSVVKLP